VDLCLSAGFGEEASYVEPILDRFQGRSAEIGVAGTDLALPMYFHHTPAAM